MSNGQIVLLGAVFRGGASNPAWLVGGMVAYAVVANAPCLIVRRYNRGRLLRVLTRRNRTSDRARHAEAA